MFCRPRLALSLVGCAVLFSVSARRARAQETVEPTLIELGLGRLASRTVHALRSGSDVLLPLSEFFDLAEIRYEIPSRGTIEAILQPGSVRLDVDSRHDTLTLGKRPIAIPHGAVLEQEGELFLSTGVLGSLLNVRFVIDWSDLNVTVADPERLPLGRRIQREASRSSLSAYYDGNVLPDLALTLDRRHWNGVVLDYSLLSPAKDAFKGGSFATGVGMDLFGGSMEMGLASVGRMDEGKLRADLSWTGVWRQHRWLKQLRVGDGLSTGPNPRTLRGFAISNSPFQRPTVLGDAAYAGRLGPGWQIEAYRGGRLVALDSADALGQFSVDVPIQYGENPIDFVAYGPFGEVREFNQTYRVVSNVLPRRQFEYGVAGGQCRTTACTASANVDVRYGISRRWTIQAGMDQFWRDSLPDLFHPYAAISGNLGNSWGVQLEGVAGAVVRTGLTYEPSNEVRVSTELTGFARGTVSPILTPAGRLRQWTTDAFFRPVKSIGSMYVDGSVDLIQSLGGTSTSARVALSFQAADIRMLPSVRLQNDALIGARSTRRTFYGLNTFMLPRTNLGHFLSTVTARTTIETEGSLHPVSASAFVARPIGSAFRVETGLSWARATGTMFSLVLSTTLNSVRAFSTFTSGPSGTDAVNYAQGSVLYSPDRHQVSLSSGPSVQRAGVSGQVFLDSNGNGRRDPDEELLPDVRVRVGNITSSSDSQGRYHVWDLLPFEPVLVVVDSMSLASPLWIPTYSAVSLEPNPNQFRLLDLPIAPGGVIEGQVIRESAIGPHGMGGITLVVTERKSGVRRGMMTFSDGGFYLLGIKPGEYDITVSEATSSRLKMTAEPVHFTMAASREGETVSGLQVILKP